MKIFLVIFFCTTFGMNVTGQITYEHTYSGSGIGNPLYVVHLENSGTKYCRIIKSSNLIILYNLDHSLFRQITVPVQPDTLGYYIFYIAETLFDNDSTDVDYMVGGCNWGCYSPPYIRIYNENGTLVFSRDTAWYLGQLAVSGTIDNLTIIYNTELGTKMILYTDSNYPPFDYERKEIYSLPGKLICSPCDFSNIISGNQEEFSGGSGFSSNLYPNPAYQYTRVDFNLPEGSNQAEIVFYDVSGNEIRRYKVDRTFSFLKIKTGDFAPGNYYYQIISAGEVQNGKKMVIIK